MRVLHDHPGLQRAFSHAKAVPRPLAVRGRAHLRPSLSSTTCSSSPCSLACKAASLADAPAYRDAPSLDHEAATAKPLSPYNYLDHWWPVAFERDIDPDNPYAFTLLGIPLVIWKEPSAAGSQWRAFKDVCPHRLVPLSEGRVNSKGLLECGYHGWAFKGDGSCAIIPQGAPCGSARACAVSYPVTVQQGLLFVKPVPLANPVNAQLTQQQQQQLRPDQHVGSNGSSPAAAGAAVDHGSHHRQLQQQEQQQQDAGVDVSDVPLVAEVGEPGWVAQDTWRDVPLDWSTVLENVLDASHVPFTHHKSISNRNVLGAYDIKLDGGITPQGFSGRWEQGPRAGALGPQTTQLYPPSLMTHKIVYRNGKVESMVVVYAVPIGPGQCRLINRNLFKFNGSNLPGLVMKAFPQFLLHIGTQVPLEDDQIFLHAGELEYAQQRAQGRNVAQAYYMPDPADTYVLAFRRWLDKFGGGGPFGPMGSPAFVEAMGLRRDRSYLLDRYSQHTSKCATCQSALKKVDTAQQVLQVVQAVAGAAALLTLATALAGVGSAVAASSTSLASGQAMADTAAGGISWLLTRFSSGLLLLAQMVVGAASGSSSSVPADLAQAPALQGLLLRAAAWGLVFAASTAVRGSLAQLWERFFKGEYPPPRNTDRT